jgi:hypothetical protein
MPDNTQERNRYAVKCLAVIRESRNMKTGDSLERDSVPPEHDKLAHRFKTGDDWPEVSTNLLERFAKVRRFVTTGSTGSIQTIDHLCHSFYNSLMIGTSLRNVQSLPTYRCDGHNCSLVDLYITHKSFCFKDHWPYNSEAKVRDTQLQKQQWYKFCLVCGITAFSSFRYWLRRPLLLFRHFLRQQLNQFRCS